MDAGQVNDNYLDLLKFGDDSRNGADSGRDPPGTEAVSGVKLLKV